MFYSQLVHNKKNWSWLTTSYNRNKLPHALLFHGNSGCGKEGHAIELTALINCKSSSSNGACGLCPDCTKLKSFQHPNVYLIIPYPKRKSLTKNDSPDKSLNNNDIDTLVQLKKQKGKDPYKLMELSGANTILINSIRHIKKELYKTSIESGWKVVLVFQAEKLCIPTPESANALLKILEEPPDKTLFILTSNHSSLILDTIKSRCQQTYFPPLNFNDIVSIINNNKKSDEELKIIFHITNGDINLIKKILKSPYNILLEAEELLNLIIDSDYEKWGKFSEKIGKTKRLGEINWQQPMKFLLVIIRDILLVSKKSNNDYLALPKLHSKYIDITKNYPIADWNLCLHIIEDTINHIQNNGYLPLMINSMAIEVNRILNGEKNNYSMQNT